MLSLTLALVGATLVGGAAVAVPRVLEPLCVAATPVPVRRVR